VILSWNVFRSNATKYTFKHIGNLLNCFGVICKYEFKAF